MNSNMIAEGIIKAVLIIAFWIGAFVFFREYPWVLVPVGIIGVTVMMLKDIGVLRTLCWLVILGGMISLGWGIFLNYAVGKSVEAGSLFLGGAVAMAVFGKVDDCLKKRANSL